MKYARAIRIRLRAEGRLLRRSVGMDCQRKEASRLIDGGDHR
jgi:hypothetical protein